MGVYAITNVETGIRYVGSTTCLKRRILRHRQYLRRGAHGTEALQRAWNEHGEAAFRFDVIEVCDTIEQARAIEADLLRGDGLYNETRIATGFGVGAKNPNAGGIREEHKLAMSLRRNGVSLSSEHVEAIRAGIRGTTKPDHWRERRSKELTTLWQSEEYRSRTSASMRKPRERRVCPHCGTEGAGGNMGRYHFENCRSRHG